MSDDSLTTTPVLATSSTTPDSPAGCKSCLSPSPMKNVHTDDTSDVLYCAGCGSLCEITWDAEASTESWTVPLCRSPMPVS